LQIIRVPFCTFFSGDFLLIDPAAGNDTVKLLAANQDTTDKDYKGFKFIATFIGNPITGAGNDSVTLEAKNTGGIGFSPGGLHIDTGAGNDKVNLWANQDGGYGFDLYGLSLTTGAGKDQVSVTAKDANGFYIDPDLVLIHLDANIDLVGLDGGSQADRLVNSVFTGPGTKILNFEKISNK
jgi:hypothetical protein